MWSDELEWVRGKGCGHPADCLEAAKLPNGGVAIRTSNEPEKLTYVTVSEFAAFLEGAKVGDFDSLI